ncbi:MAG TPA: hypothetical protein VG317_08140 [Pseudonocardiaceae bacterium]|nr:hypothetical protein [Pseudonocardiaceae bacterium]
MRRRLLAGLGGLGLVVLLAACGSGQITQTDTQVAGVNGASGNIGPIAVRNAELAFPDNAQGVFQPGSNATLVVTIVNTGITSDELLKITSPAADGVTIDGSPTGTKPLPGSYSISSGVDSDDQGSPVAPGTSSTTGSTGSSTVTSATSPAKTGASSTAPSSTGPNSTGPNSTGPSTTAAAAGPGKVAIVLTGLKTINNAPLRAGLTVPITFYFANAGQLTLDVPVGAPADSSAPTPTTSAPAQP